VVNVVAAEETNRELLIAEHRMPADRLTASLRWVFNVIGERIH